MPRKGNLDRAFGKPGRRGGGDPLLVQIGGGLLLVAILLLAGVSFYWAM